MGPKTSLRLHSEGLKRFVTAGDHSLFTETNTGIFTPKKIHPHVYPDNEPVVGP